MPLKYNWIFSCIQLRGLDSNQRPPGYEPGELPLLYPAISLFNNLNIVTYKCNECKSTPMTDKQKKIIDIARSFVGTPYKYAVSQEEIPGFFDCSSFTQFVYKQIGIEIPRSTIMQATTGKEITDIKNLEPGDLLFYRGSKGHYNDELFPERQIYIGHVALLSGNNKVIHATSAKGVIEENSKEIIIGRGPIVIVKRIL